MSKINMKELKEKYKEYREKVMEAKQKAEKLHKAAVKYVNQHPIPEHPLSTNNYGGLISGNQFSESAKRSKPNEPRFKETAIKSKPSSDRFNLPNSIISDTIFTARGKPKRK